LRPAVTAMTAMVATVARENTDAAVKTGSSTCVVSVIVVVDGVATVASLDLATKRGDSGVASPTDPQRKPPYSYCHPYLDRRIIIPKK